MSNPTQTESPQDKIERLLEAVAAIINEWVACDDHTCTHDADDQPACVLRRTVEEATGHVF